MRINPAAKIVNGSLRGLEIVRVLPHEFLAREFIDGVFDRDTQAHADALQLLPALQLLSDTCNNEAKLTPIGRFAVHRQIVELLVNFAHLTRARCANASIADETIASPVFITGLPRTGSTILHALLAQDPDVRVPATWEVMRPPVAHGGKESGIKYCERRLRWAHWLAPRFRAIHPLGARLPQECIAITAHVFRSIVFHTTQHVPSYQDWLENDGHEIAYRFHRQFLQNLQYFGGAGRWVLKAPGHMFRMRALFAEYPNAIIVHTHRDPVRVAASLASHATVLRSAFSDSVDSRQVAADWLDRWWRAIDQLLDVRADHEDVFVDVYYSEFMQDPLRIIEKLYSRLGWTLTRRARQRMAAFLSANPKGKHGEHRYSLCEFGLDRELLLERANRYHSSFSIKEEPLRM